MGVAYQALEGKLANEKLSRLLVAADLTESDGTRLVAMGLLDTAGRWRALASGFGGELLARGFATGRLASSLLSARHCE
jgi:hypothetical protein